MMPYFWNNVNFAASSVKSAILLTNQDQFPTFSKTTNFSIPQVISIRYKFGPG